MVFKGIRMQKVVNRSLLMVAFIFCTSSAFSQEINCVVTVNHQKVQSTDKSIFESLESGITEFVNTKRWTGDQYKVEERIECKLLIIIDSRSDNSFSATIQVSASRPVFGTNYKTSMFNINDNDFKFTYNDQQALNFNQGEYQSELTAVIAYYVYVILGVDYDSYSMEGGKEYYQKAFDIVSLAQTSSSSTSWKPTTDNNRYTLIENLTNTVFTPFRECLYMYHRKGLDMMKDKKSEAYVNLINALTKLEAIHKVKPSSYLLQIFFLGKYSEIVSMYKTRSQAEKNRVVQLLLKLDPGNTKHYNKILETK
ncbi:MAG: hypothetical protein ACJAZ2_000865 [Glaciecola sp.]|jgi:hypothetical protein